MIQPTILQNEKIWQTSSYTTQYFRNMIQNTNYVLCTISAAEYLGMYSGTTDKEIYVFQKEDCITHHVEFAEKNGLLFTTVNQTINDLLQDTNIDDQVILEALADQYHKNNYAELQITPTNQHVFEHFKSMAEKYYLYE